MARRAPLSSAPHTSHVSASNAGLATCAHHVGGAELHVVRRRDEPHDAAMRQQRPLRPSRRARRVDDVRQRRRPSRAPAAHRAVDVAIAAASAESVTRGAFVCGRRCVALPVVTSAAIARILDHEGETLRRIARDRGSRYAAPVLSVAEHRDDELDRRLHADADDAAPAPTPSRCRCQASWLLRVSSSP